MVSKNGLSFPVPGRYCGLVDERMAPRSGAEGSPGPSDFLLCVLLAPVLFVLLERCGVGAWSAELRRDAGLDGASPAEFLRDDCLLGEPGLLGEVGRDGRAGDSDGCLLGDREPRLEGGLDGLAVRKSQYSIFTLAMQQEVAYPAHLRRHHYCHHRRRHHVRWPEMSSTTRASSHVS